MKTLFYQPTAGVAGDLHLAALLDLGVPLADVEAQLAKLSLSGEYRLEARPAAKMGISGTQLIVHAKDQHDHRHHSTIVRAIQEAEFAPDIERRALDMFERIALAEAKIHGISVEEVHFHEVGAIDSIVDIVGAAIAIELLGVEHIVSNPVEVGSGMVRCAHGLFPVPAPATQEILAGVPCLYGGVDGESTTPTGAAILAANVDEFSPQAAFEPQQFGYGIGHKDFEIPNVLRVVLGEMAIGTGQPAHCKIEANIDDMSAEAFAPLIQGLLDLGADDAWSTPIVMKKGRPASQVSVLCASAQVDQLADYLFNHSTTLGLRVMEVDKRMLAREERQIVTRYGEVRVKLARRPNGTIRFKAEHDDVQRLAQQHGVDALTLRQHIDTDILTHLDG